MGMATAAGVTGISLVAGRGLRRGLNWGVGSFCFVSLASWETCRRNIKAEQMRMRTVIEGYRKSRVNQQSATSALASEGLKGRVRDRRNEHNFGDLQATRRMLVKKAAPCWPYSSTGSPCHPHH